MSNLKREFQDSRSDECYDFSKIQKKRRRAGPRTDSEPSKSTVRKDSNIPGPSKLLEPSETASDGLDDATPCMVEDIRSENISAFALHTEQRYLLELKKNNGIHLTDIRKSEFLVQDYSLAGHTLKVNSYCVVKRKKVDFADGKQWVWSCTCNRHFVRYYNGLTNCVADNFADFQHEMCIHIKSVACSLSSDDNDSDEELDDHTYQSLSVEKSDVWGITVNEEPRCIVRCHEKLGVVRCFNGHLECLVCKFGQHECVHVKKVQQLMETDEDVPDIIDSLVIALMESQGIQGEQKLKCISSCKIPFKRKEPFPEHDNVFKAPEHCDQCCAVTHTKENKETSLYKLKTIECSTVSSTECINCKDIKYYDGCDDGILHMGKFLMHHEVLRQYMYLFVYARCSLHAYYCMWRNIQEDEGNTNFSKRMPYRDFRLAWYEFLQLLEIDYHAGFECKQCGPNPETVIMDATSLGHRKIYQNWYKSNPDTLEKQKFGR